MKVTFKKFPVFIENKFSILFKTVFFVNRWVDIFRANRFVSELKYF